LERAVILLFGKRLGPFWPAGAFFIPSKGALLKPPVRKRKKAKPLRPKTALLKLRAERRKVEIGFESQKRAKEEHIRKQEKHRMAKARYTWEIRDNTQGLIAAERANKTARVRHTGEGRKFWHTCLFKM